MCILVLCQHKCFFSHESFAFLIHSFCRPFFSLCLPFVRICLHHFTSFYSRQFHYRFKILLFNCFSIRFCLSWVDLLSFSVVLSLFLFFFRFYFSYFCVCVFSVRARIRVRIEFHQTILRWWYGVCELAAANLMLIIFVIQNKLTKKKFYNISQ